jgi:uncharacterized protein
MPAAQPARTPAQSRRAMFRAAVTARTILLGLVALSAACASGPPPLRLATGSAGGTYDRIGHDIARYSRQNKAMPVVEALRTTGTEENLRLVREGHADLALVTAEALTASPDAPEGVSACVVGALYRGGAHFVVRRAIARSGNLSDLNGALLYPGAAGSGTEAGTLAILDALDIKADLVPTPGRTLDYEASAQALVHGHFDAVALSGGPPVESVRQLLESHPRRFTILSFSPEQLDRVTAAVPGLEATEIAGGTYAHQPQAIATVGKLTVLIARPDLAEGVRASLGGALAEGITEPDRGLRAANTHPILGGVTPEFWTQSLGSPRCPE